ncbi:9788_t:CDS:2 [Entrophospora sp. SA101]|nr:9788_t:CDS:2 [Entrophospora sp. SA101]
MTNLWINRHPNDDEFVVEKDLKESTSKLDRTEEGLYLSIEKKLKEQKELLRKIKVSEDKDESSKEKIKELEKKLEEKELLVDYLKARVEE